jgi:Holliday junction resolvase
MILNHVNIEVNMSKKKINSRAKGARGERELSKVLRDHGWDARRGQQFSGSPDSPDVVSNLPYQIECKRVESLNLYKALEQATKDAEGSGKPPIVCHKKNGKDWVVILNLNDFLQLVEKSLSSEI